MNDLEKANLKVQALLERIMELENKVATLRVEITELSNTQNGDVQEAEIVE